jgi:geranylgeranyl diphosphate synthase type 3
VFGIRSGGIRAGQLTLTIFSSCVDVLQQRPTSPTLKTYAIDYMEHRTNSFEYTLSILNDLECEIRKEIDNFGGNGALSKIIDALHVEATDFL